MRYAPGWGHTPADFARALAGDESAKALKATTHPVTGRSVVSVFATDLAMPASTKRAGASTSARVVVKVSPLPGLKKQAQSLLKRTKHHRQWKGHELLAAAGVDSSTPLAILRARTEDGEAEVLILEHVTGKTLLERFAEYQDGVPVPSLIAPALAHTITRLVSHHLWNRDPKPSNILTHEPGEGGVGITLLDTVGIERRASRKNAFLRHFIRLLLLETRGSNAPVPPDFAARLVTAVLGAKASASDVSELLAGVEREVADDDGTPTDSPLPTHET